MYFSNLLSPGVLVACLRLHRANASSGKLGRPTEKAASSHPPLSASGVGGLWDYIVSCEGSPDSSDFTVKLGFDDGFWTPAKCVRSYSLCPYTDGSCVVEEDGWTAQSGRSFNYLETRVFYVSDDSSPVDVYVNDDKGSHGCARALYKHEYQDFDLGSSLDVSKWWSGGDPLQVTIVPFNPGSGSCATGSDFDFDASRALAVWLSPYKGQEQDPSDGSIYCDISKNPEQCLNMPYWTVEGNELVSHGTLANALQRGKDLSIYIPEGYDIFLPINNNEVRFEISSGYLNKCKKFLSDGSSSCKVNKGWVTYFPTTSKITVSGLGRINGWNAMNQQRDGNIRMYGGGDGDIDLVTDNSDFSGYWQNIGLWYIYAHLLTLNTKSGGTGDKFAMDVSGVEVAWGSRLGHSPVSLNSPWTSNGDDELASHPGKMYDVKLTGFWNDQADGIDIMGSGSYTAYTYLHTNDDAVKVGAPSSTRLETTTLKGNAGCVVNLGSYGLANIEKSTVDGVYVHRIVHSSWQFQGCGSMGSDGGVVCTRSCGQNSKGLIDTTVSNLHVPEIGDANSVATPFGIGVRQGGDFCGGGTAIDWYPIRNLRFEYFYIHPNPSCKSSFYDDTSGKVQWGLDSPYWPSVTFYDAEKSACDFEGAVSFTDNPPYFVCGYPDEDSAKNHCMTTDGIGGAPNINYDVTSDVKIEFPVCSATERAQELKSVN